MAWALRMALVAAYLLTTISAADDYTNQVSVAQDKKLLTEEEKGPILVVATQLFVITAVIVGTVILFYHLIIAWVAKKYPEKFEPEEYDTYSYYGYEEPYYNRRAPYGSYKGKYSQRSLADNESFLTRVLNSIDPVESAFVMLQVEELACRRRTVCELQKAASRMPILGSLLQYVSPSIRGLEIYREAQEAGAALEDCALLFSECPTTVVQSLWGDN